VRRPTTIAATLLVMRRPNGNTHDETANHLRFRENNGGMGHFHSIYGMDDDVKGGQADFSFIFHFNLCFFAIVYLLYCYGVRRLSIVALSVWRWVGFWLFLFPSWGSKEGKAEGGERRRHSTSSCLYYFLICFPDACIHLYIPCVYFLWLPRRLLYQVTIYSIIHSSTRLPDNSWSSTRPLTSVKRK
jgi:hypothetical protein